MKYIQIHSWFPPEGLRPQDGPLASECLFDVISSSDGTTQLACRSTKTPLSSYLLQIFDKALDEPKYSSMYAQLCKRLSEEAPNFEPPNIPCTFRVLLLNKCRDEFENR